MHLRTGKLSDVPDKYVRMTIRNAKVNLKGADGAAPPSKDPTRSQFKYPSEDARDRGRSSWATFHELCDRLADAVVVEPPQGAALRRARLGGAQSFERRGRLCLRLRFDPKKPPEGTFPSPSVSALRFLIVL